RGCDSGDGVALRRRCGGPRGGGGAVRVGAWRRPGLALPGGGDRRHAHARGATPATAQVRRRARARLVQRQHDRRSADAAGDGTGAGAALARGGRAERGRLVSRRHNPVFRIAGQVWSASLSLPLACYRRYVDELPIFPLDVVVFPGMTVPITVTEERYRRLVRLTLAQDSEPKRFIATLALKNAPIRDTPVQLERYGTLVHVLSVEETEDGGFELLVHGQERCEVTPGRHENDAEAGGATRPVHVAESTPAPDGRDHPKEEAVAAWDASNAFRTYAGTLVKGDAATEIDMHLPDDPFY